MILCRFSASTRAMIVQTDRLELEAAPVPARNFICARARARARRVVVVSGAKSIIIIINTLGWISPCITFAWIRKLITMEQGLWYRLISNSTGYAVNYNYRMTSYYVDVNHNNQPTFGSSWGISHPARSQGGSTSTVSSSRTNQLTWRLFRCQLKQWLVTMCQ